METLYLDDRVCSNTCICTDQSESNGRQRPREFQSTSPQDHLDNADTVIHSLHIDELWKIFCISFYWEIIQSSSQTFQFSFPKKNNHCSFCSILVLHILIKITFCTPEQLWLLNLTIFFRITIFVLFFFILQCLKKFIQLFPLVQFSAYLLFIFIIIFVLD